VTFEWPQLLLSLLLVPLLALGYWWSQRQRSRYTLRFTNLALVEQVMGPGPGLRRHVPPLCYLLGLTSLFISLARPNAMIPVPRDQGLFVLVLDVSGSMTAADLLPSRMEAARTAAISFVEALPDDAQVAVVSFNTGAHLVAPLTRDREVIYNAIHRLAPGGGTAIGEGLHLALDQVADRPEADGEKAPAVLVLLSDGESRAGRPPEQAAQRALDDGVPVYTVGVGQRDQLAMVGSQQVRLDEVTLQNVAEITGADYYYAAESSDLAEVYTTLSRKTGFEVQRTEVTALASGLGALLVMAGAFLGTRWMQRLP
jgi:Ca-activated chloride channel family protein